MKSNNPDQLLTYLVLNEVFCWLVTVVLMVFMCGQERKLEPWATGMGGLLLGTLTTLGYYLCNRELLFQSPWRAILAALTTPLLQGTKINRITLIYYLLNRLTFTNIAASFSALLLDAYGIHLAYILLVYSITCVFILFCETLLLSFWELRSAFQEYEEQKDD